jgi:hypothetical protein
MKLITHLHLLPRSRMVELYLHCLHVLMEWCRIKHRDNFTFYFTLNVKEKGKFENLDVEKRMLERILKNKAG